MKTLRYLSLSLLVACCLAAALPALAGKGDTRIAVLGDRTGGANQEVFTKVIDRIDALGPDALITVGDIIQGYTEDQAVVRQQWDEVLKTMAVLDLPICWVPGNHDIWDDASEAIYRERAGEPMHSVTYGDLHVSVLDSSRMKSAEPFSPEALAWLRKDLKKHKRVTFKVVVFHKPGWWYADDITAYELHPICKEFGVSAVITGHYHTYAYREVEGIQYISMGSSGGGMGDEIFEDGHFYHFGWITVGDQGFRFTPISLDGVHTADVVPHEEIKYVYYIRQSSLWVEPAGEDYLLKLENFRDAPTDVTLEIDTEETSWTVELAEDSWVLDPLTVLEVPFKASVPSVSKRFPLPTFTMQYEASEGRMIEVEDQFHLPRTATCVKTDQPPAIDGVLDDRCWPACRPLTYFASVSAEPADTEWAEFYLTWDDENLYLAAHCRESVMSGLKAAAEEHDGQTYLDDNVRLYLDPGGNQQGLVYLVVNPKGAIFDDKLAVTEENDLEQAEGWEPVLEGAGSQGFGGWSVEVKIPFDQLPAEPPQAGDQWGFNLVRVQLRSRAFAIYNTPAEVHPRAYARLEFAETGE